MHFIFNIMTLRTMAPPLLPLPLNYLVTPEPSADQPLSHFIAHLERTLKVGIRLVQLRAKTLTESQYTQLAKEALACCRHYNARLLLNAPIDMVQNLKADGVHLSSTNLMTSETRPLTSDFLISAACHDAHQVLHANRIGVDLLTISPILPTATHTTAKPMGWARFKELTALTSIPVYALGGINHSMLYEAREAGAYGIAAIRALWASKSAVLS
jgi:thiamine-phosphate pyrophosphorylase